MLKVMQKHTAAFQGKMGKWKGLPFPMLAILKKDKNIRAVLDLIGELICC